MTEIRKNGQVGIIDGKIKVVDPEGGGRSAVLYPPDDGVTIIVNGEVLEEALEVDELDLIEVKPAQILEEAKIVIELSSDELYAVMAAYPRIISKYFLEDSEMKGSLKPKTGKTEHREKVLTVMDAEAELKKRNIVHGINVASLKEIIETADGEFKIAAKGREVVEGGDGYIEYIINPDVEEINYEGEEQKVDYREKFRFPSVKKEDIIAVVHPPVEGTPGLSVLGNIIPAKPVKSVRAKCGEGVELAGNGSVVALKDGRLFVKGSRIKVVNLLTHHGDVDLESGNIRFNGDVQIFGNITEGMIVESQGDLLVEGNAYGSTLKAGGGIRVSKNIIKCQVEGGIYFSLLQKITPLLEKLGDGYSSVIYGLKEVVNGLSKRGQKLDENTMGLVFRSVMEKSSSVLLEEITGIEKLLNMNDNQSLTALKELITSLKANCTPPFKSNLAGLMEIVEVLKTFSDSFLENLNQIPKMSASYIQNSNVIHSGEINVIGQGCYFTTILSGEGVYVQGVFRGGLIEARGDVKMKEFVYIATASELAAKKPVIRIKVPAHRSILFGVVHEDTTIQVGQTVYRFDRKHERVKVCYNTESGMLQINDVLEGG